MGSARSGRPHNHQPRSVMKLSVCCALLASLPLCLSESASGLSHVVKVGRNGRQVVHQASRSKGSGGKSLGRKVRRRGRNTLGQPALALHQAPAAPVPLVHSTPQVFTAHPTHQHVVHHAAPALPAPQAFSHHHVPHAPSNLFHFAHHGPAIDPNLHHPALHHAAHAPLAPVQFVAPAFIHHPAPLPVAPLPIAPVQQVQVAAPAPPLPEDAPAVIAVGRAAEPEAAPVEVVEVRTPETLYGAPAEEVEVEVAKIADSYLAVPEPVVAPADSYLSSEPAPLPVPDPAPLEVPAPPAPVAVEVVGLKEAVAPRDSYIQPVVPVPEPVIEVVAPAVIEARDSYGAPAVVEARDSYGAPSEPIAVVKSDVLAATRVDPIAIVRSVLNAPDTIRAAKDGWDYSYEAANGIKQEATGTLRQIDDSRVSVMRGSYEFVGADGIVYAVEWFADETGFHATAPHLPQNVVPNHPEVAAAVKAQIAFAEQEDLAAASGVVAARAPLDSYGALPSYGYY